MVSRIAYFGRITALRSMATKGTDACIATNQPKLYFGKWYRTAPNGKLAKAAIAKTENSFMLVS